MAGNDIEDEIREAVLRVIGLLACHPTDQKTVLVIAGNRGFLPADEVTLLIHSLGLEHV